MQDLQTVVYYLNIGWNNIWICQHITQAEGGKFNNMAKNMNN